MYGIYVILRFCPLNPTPGAAAGPPSQVEHRNLATGPKATAFMLMLWYIYIFFNRSKIKGGNSKPKFMYCQKCKVIHCYAAMGEKQNFDGCIKWHFLKGNVDVLKGCIHLHPNHIWQVVFLEILTVQILLLPCWKSLFASLDISVHRKQNTTINGVFVCESWQFFWFKKKIKIIRFIWFKSDFFYLNQFF